MYIPTSTYRVQLSTEFTLKDLEKVIDYLEKLGISTIYAAPILQARPGSLHGYDVVNTEIVNPEIGSLDDLNQLGEILKNKQMGWLQDIVPNHMAFHHLNPWIKDILEKGEKSIYREFFDVNWTDLTDHMYDNKLMAPFLGSSMQEVLSRQELKLQLDYNGLYFQYFDHIYPLSLTSYKQVLLQLQSFFRDNYSKSVAMETELRNSIEEIDFINQNAYYDYDQVIKFKKKLYELYTSNGEFQNGLNEGLQKINQDPASLHYLLENQHYILVHWKETERKINYRRFFTINDLICLNMQHPEVFKKYHAFLKTLYDQGLIHGLRIDHIDGLFNPGEYLQNVREYFGDELYLIVEKILEWGESVPIYWPIQGTTGYGFMATISHLFTDWRNQNSLTDTYHHVIEDAPDYHYLVYEKKYFIIKERMGGELNNLMQQMRILNLLSPDYDEYRVKDALAAFLVAHTVYRIYPTQYPLSQESINILHQAYLHASSWKPELKQELAYLYDVFTKTLGENKMLNDNKLYFLMRCQQFTGPLEAKGVEDTSFYLYNRLISHNEVGDSPDIFGISHREFHEKMMTRQLLKPHAMSATATHDTKRGEDMRTRINVISELPTEWSDSINEWRALNKGLLKQYDSKIAPDPNDEYFIYQTIVGAFPMNGEINEHFNQRIKDYMIKVVREGKVNSSWSSPNQMYEYGICDFLDSILDPQSKFLNSARPFIQRITHYGIIYSLCQTLFKATAPGVPDVYQGSEFWDLNLVDPDNRRPIDYSLREQYLDEITAKQDDLKGLSAELLRYKTDDKLKLFTLHRSLQERKNNKSLFDHGKYLPLTISGRNSWHAIGFLRNYEDQWSMTVSPRHLVPFIDEYSYPHGEAIWEDTFLEMPSAAPENWRNVFTGEQISLGKTALLSDIFTNFPVVFLIGT